MRGSKGACATWEIEDRLGRRDGFHIAGVDEVARGPFAGCCVAGCAVYDPKVELSISLHDSKAYHAKRREELVEYLTKEFIEKGLLHVAYAEASPEEIDNAVKGVSGGNLNKLILEKFGEALKQLPPYDQVIVDGEETNEEWAGCCMPKADERSITVATASIFAKVYHDKKLHELDKLYPQYGFANHVGYGTPEHIQAILSFGPIPGVHRMTFLQNLRKKGWKP